MTDEELKDYEVRIEETNLELEVIMQKIQDHQTELDVLWDKYWKAYGKLTDMIVSGKENE